MKSAAFKKLYKTVLPPDELKMFVKEYWIYDIKNRVGTSTSRELRQPLLFPEIIFKIGVDYENFYLKKNQVEIISGSTICGIQSGAIGNKRVNTEEPLLLITIKLEYAGLYQLLNMPLIELFDNRILKEDISNNFLKKLEDLLYEAKNTNEIVATLNKELIKYFYNQEVNSECLRFTSLVNSMNATSLAQLKNDSRLSYKYLERRFKKYIGITPKKYFKLKRYLSFYESWLKHNHYNYIDLVYENNFFDQNHLIKDFKSVLNQSPNQFKKTKDGNFVEYLLLYKLNLL